MTENGLSISIIDELANFIFVSKYARYDSKKKRRETWDEAVSRVEDMHLKKYHYLSDEDKEKIKWAFGLVRDKRVLPSMRSLQFGGKAIEAHNEKIYNCAVRHVDSLRSVAEIMYLLLAGCGVGIGLFPEFLDRLPNLVSPLDKNGIILSYVVEDSIEGWANSVEVLLSAYFQNTPYSGRKIAFDYSRIRKKGAPLVTSGGKAPGYLSLKNTHLKIKAILDFIIEVEKQTRIKSINIYDIIMHCADAVLSGGVRRSATSIIFSVDDKEMVESKILFDVAKKGRFEYNEKRDVYEGYVMPNDSVYNGKVKIEVELSKNEYDMLMKSHKISWMHVHPQRARSNNSVLLLRDKITLQEFTAIVERTKEFGEPGFVFANNPRQLYNPCFEVGFIPVTDNGMAGVQFCNLTSQNGAKINSVQDFMECVEAGAIIGTLQAGYTWFPFLSPTARKLTEEESLIGCSITGMFNNPKVLLDPQNLRRGAEKVLETNRKWAGKIGINPASRTTLIKPEGTGSLVLGKGSDLPSAGIHLHKSHKFMRLVQVNKIDPVYKYFKKYNPHAVEESVWSSNKTDDVIYFPIEVDNRAEVQTNITALAHLDVVKMVQENWVKVGTSESNKKDIEHSISCTIEVEKDEWGNIIKYLFDNRYNFSAVSLLSKTGDRDYPQAPFQRIDAPDREEKFVELKSKWKKVDYTQLAEEEDNTILQAESSCVGANCEVIS